NAFQKPTPPDENYKYVNYKYRNKSLAVLYGCNAGVEETPLLKYTQGVLAGKYKGDNLFASVLQAMVLKHDKQERGVGMQNFQYMPDLIEFAHIIHTHSPKAYKFLRDHLPLMDSQTIKYV
ncbi:hypothetical protein L208DRAFT_1329136, partial [Tricholoma matsutake]